ncbi:hypothetical protein MSAR_22860 [Mycolicibacterium sarraceniae]|uniref:Uncharacterized protein n=1 Tax=Mycolicibacterium sarraceniae TaxID=1534348 RepID=A0A7I7SRC8_9MYCO|nr:hypothetical protein MSAR_22860 [Mycolicibacterium sarraceniae]
MPSGVPAFTANSTGPLAPVAGAVALMVTVIGPNGVVIVCVVVLVSDALGVLAADVAPADDDALLDALTDGVLTRLVVAALLLRFGPASVPASALVDELDDAELEAWWPPASAWATPAAPASAAPTPSVRAPAPSHVLTPNVRLRPLVTAVPVLVAISQSPVAAEAHPCAGWLPTIFPIFCGAG